MLLYHCMTIRQLIVYAEYSLNVWRKGVVKYAQCEFCMLSVVNHTNASRCVKCFVWRSSPALPWQQSLPWAERPVVSMLFYLVGEAVIKDSLCSKVDCRPGQTPKARAGALKAILGSSLLHRHEPRQTTQPLTAGTDQSGNIWVLCCLVIG